MTPKRTVGSMLTLPLRLSLRNPLVTGPLLFALTYYPQKVTQLLPPKLQSIVTSNGFFSFLAAGLAISVIRQVNNWFSQRVLDNWKPAAKFNPSQELVLISGGSSGIGEMMAKDFAKKGAEVVILDVNPPKKALRKSTAKLYLKTKDL